MQTTSLLCWTFQNRLLSDIFKKSLSFFNDMTTIRINSMDQLHECGRPWDIPNSYTETNHPVIDKILKQSKLDAGIEEIPIAVFFPDSPENYARLVPHRDADIHGCREEGYGMSVNPGVLKYPESVLRELIDHEVCHVLYKDPDTNLNWFLLYMHTKFIAEPRARRYARRNAMNR
ncbi:MAG: hypothetical protein ABIC04_01865 [Nanoarchaeota archaeon]